MAMHAAAGRSRIESIDVLRGIVMVIMALDHARDFFSFVPDTTSGFALDPTNLATTTPLLFLTRWITHFCAPAFVFLSGISAYLMRGRRTVPDLRAFLIKRGIWLIFVELVIITFAWSFNPLYNLFFFQVIWAIGISMVLLGLAIALPARVIGLIGVLIILGHNLQDLPALAEAGKGSLWTDAVFDGFFSYHPISANRGILLVYAFLPWTGLMFLGYGIGSVYTAGFDPLRRRRLLRIAGLSVIALFFLLRFINIYGDPAPWSVQPRGSFYTFLSFVNTTKYPASLQYTLMTIGPSLLILAGLERYRNRVTEFFNQFGRVPMFYYIVHLYLLHLLSVGLFFAQGFGTKDIIQQGTPFFFLPPGFGVGLAGVYGFWALSILLLYPMCRWYNRYKQTHQFWWLSYL